MKTLHYKLFLNVKIFHTADHSNFSPQPSHLTYEFCEKNVLSKNKLNKYSHVKRVKWLSHSFICGCRLDPSKLLVENKPLHFVATLMRNIYYIWCSYNRHPPPSPVYKPGSHCLVYYYHFILFFISFSRSLSSTLSVLSLFIFWFSVFATAHYNTYCNKSFILYVERK